MFRKSEMREPRYCQRAAAHKTVGGCARPTRFENKTSHTLPKVEPRAEKIRVSERETMRIFRFDGNARAASIGE